MKDVIAEPYRERLLPGFRQARQAVAEIGAVASGISGSGPTLFALCDKPDTAQRVPTGWVRTTCKIRKVLFIFAGWIRRAHEYWKTK